MKTVYFRLNTRNFVSFLKKWNRYIVISLILCALYLIIPSIIHRNHKLSDWIDLKKYQISTFFLGDPFIKTDAYIINTYYYPKSKSLGENAIGMVLLMNRNTMRDMRRYQMQLIASDIANRSVVVVPKLSWEIYGSCDYIPMVANTNALPNMAKLEIFDGTTKMQIPFRRAETTAPAPVVICLAPQFVAEQWQLFVAHAHVARHYGAHLHLYITSMIDSYFDLVQEYEKLGYVSLDYWIRMKFANSSEDSLEINSHSELRNQAGAQTDCLYKYKEAASFIAFFDVDDVFIPRGFRSYFDEFTALYAENPDILTFQYTKREMMFYNKPSMEDMNIEEIFGHTWFVNEEDYGKQMAKPENLNSMWIHQSWNIPEEKNMITRSNYLIHFQKPVDADGTDPVPYRRSDFEMMENMQLNISALAPIQKDLERVINTTNIQQIIDRLPKKNYYFSIIYRCYYEKFYKKPIKASCPNGEGCLVPQRSDMNCVHSDVDYRSGPQMYPITYHYHENPRWVKTKGCQP